MSLGDHLSVRREVFSTMRTELLDVKDMKQLVFWNRPVVEPQSRFVIVKLTAELHPTLLKADRSGLDDLGLILDGKSKFSVDGRDYWDGPTSRFLKYMIRVQDGLGTHVVLVGKGKDLFLAEARYLSEANTVAFTMDFDLRLGENSPWSVMVSLIGQGERPVDRG